MWAERAAWMQAPCQSAPRVAHGSHALSASRLARGLHGDDPPYTQGASHPRPQKSASRGGAEGWGILRGIFHHTHLRAEGIGILRTILCHHAFVRPFHAGPVAGYAYDGPARAPKADFWGRGWLAPWV